MEYFAMDPRILPLYAKHYATGQPLPDEIIQSKIFMLFDIISWRNYGCNFRSAELPPDRLSDLHPKETTLSTLVSLGNEQERVYI